MHDESDNLIIGKTYLVIRWSSLVTYVGPTSDGMYYITVFRKDGIKFKIKANENMIKIIKEEGIPT